MRPRPMIRCAVLALVGLAAIAPTAGAARTTGRYLVVFKRPATARSASTVSAVLARAGVRRAGRGVPRLGVATVRGPRRALRSLRRDPAVASVSPEYLRRFRRVPNDPALSTPETEYGGLPGGAPIQWALARQRFPGAWDVTTGAGALVGVIDSGIDAAHPELGGKIATLDASGTNNPGADPDGHGTHVSGLACAATDNGIGVAGAGWGCRLAVVKVPSPDIPEEAIVDAIRIATDRGAQAINMSFGGPGPPDPALEPAIDYAVQRGVVLVAAASNDADSDQGPPASQLQPGDAPNIGAGRGLVVTAADFSDRRAGTGLGNQISLAAYGFFDRDNGPPGLISTYPGNHDTARDLDCQIPALICVRRSLGGDDRYAYLQGTSMSAPQVTALAAMVAKLNPFLGLSEKLRLIKQTARRSGGWNVDLGWGILDAQSAVEAARLVDHVAPESRVRRRRAARVKRHRRRAKVRIKWSGSDPAGAPGLIPAGLRSFDLYLKRGHRRYRRVRRATRRRSARLRLRPGRYRFYTRARDRVGNREAKPRRADLRLRVKKPKRKRRRR